ncbi:hypothetical protein C8J56DRAFT_835932 [Mycena floridula]|nr:hypothetical protein C8J56DRAFT_835932 [Mycena floridula]
MSQRVSVQTPGPSRSGNVTSVATRSEEDQTQARPLNPDSGLAQASVRESGSTGRAKKRRSDPPGPEISPKPKRDRKEGEPSSSKELTNQLERALRKKDKKYDKLFHENATLRERVEVLEAEARHRQITPRTSDNHVSNDLSDSCHELEQRVKELEATLSATESQLKQATAQNSQPCHEGDAERHRADLWNSEKEALLVERSRLLATRTKELQGMQAFLSTEDIFSVADVTRMLEALNQEVFQTSAFMTDILSFELSSTASVEEQATSREISRTCIGPRITNLLGSCRSHDAFDTMVQCALQSALLRCCRVEIMKWANGGRAQEVLSSLYEAMVQSEPQAVSGRWRALTQIHFKKITPDSEKIPIAVAHFLDVLSAILVASGWSLHGPEGNKVLRQECESKVISIVKSALELNTAIRSGVTSRDLQIYMCRDGDAFNSKIMIDAYGDSGGSGSKRKAGRVLSTCDLGLVQCETGTTAKRTLIMKPKVALDISWVEC